MFEEGSPEGSFRQFLLRLHFRPIKRAAFFKMPLFKKMLFTLSLVVGGGVGVGGCWRP